MAEKRDKTIAFAGRLSEHKRISKAAEFLNIGMSEFMREPIMERVVKVEKKYDKTT